MIQKAMQHSIIHYSGKRLLFGQVFKHNYLITVLTPYFLEIPTNHLSKLKSSFLFGHEYGPLVFWGFSNGIAFKVSCGCQWTQFILIFVTDVSQQLWAKLSPSSLFSFIYLSTNCYSEHPEATAKMMYTQKFSFIIRIEIGIVF